MSKKLTLAARLACAFVWSLTLAPGAEAGVVRVPTDFVSLFQAIANAADGDTVQVVGNGGATFENTNLQIDKNLLIQGGWRADFQVRDPNLYVTVVRDTTGEFSNPVFRVIGTPNVVFDGVEIVGGQQGIRSDDGASLTVRNCTIRNQNNGAIQGAPLGPPGGGIRLVGGSLTLVDSEIRNIVTRIEGGGLALQDCASVTIRNCDVEQSTAVRIVGGDSNGGAVYADGVASLVIEDSRFDGCATISDGGFVSVANGAVQLRRCSFSNGLASRNGGAIFLDALSSAVIEDCTFTTNRAFLGGAIMAPSTTGLQIARCTFASNVASVEGGALWLDESELSVSETDFDANFRADFPVTISERGGTVRSVESTGSFTNCTFTNELALGNGGSFSVVGGEFTFDGCEFRDNEAQVFGGCVHIELAGLLRFRNSLFEGNAAKFGGSVAASFTAAIEMDRVTATRGSASSAGAVIYVDTDAVATVSNSLLCCATRGDVVHCSVGVLAFSHTNVWNDDSENQRAEYGGSCDNPTGSDGNLSLDPRFCPGATDYTLQSNSPCVGAGSGGVDIGWTGVGCSPVEPRNLEKTTWSDLKGRFRRTR